MDYTVQINNINYYNIMNQGGDVHHASLITRCENCILRPPLHCTESVYVIVSLDSYVAVSYILLNS